MDFLALEFQVPIHPWASSLWKILLRCGRTVQGRIKALRMESGILHTDDFVVLSRIQGSVLTQWFVK